MERTSFDENLSVRMKKTLVEDVLDNQFRVQWAYESHWADVEVWETVGVENGIKPLFQRKSADFSPDCVETTEEAERYLKGFIKWDGCSEFKFSPDREECMFGDFHWCGPDDYRKHFALLECLYKRSRELLEAGGEYGWDD